MAIRAIFFDFDGTLWDSEVAGFRSWQELYVEHGVEFPMEVYVSRLGTLGGLDPIDELERRVGHTLNREELEGRRWRRKLELLDDLKARPGVEDYLKEARERGLALAVVSTDDREWVLSGLRRLGLEDHWDFIECAEGDPARAKPSPALYLSALDRLRLTPGEAIAIEDSPNGIASAKRAGLFCLAVSHAVSEHLDLGAADLAVRSFVDLPLEDLIRRAEQPS